MEKIVQNLTKIASSLDSQKRIKLASQIDKFADALVQIKTAQYVGVQGYWIRNERCWSNCYRQKRAETPKKASQVVWQECQNEYVESINNPTSGWEKYAQDEKQMKFSKADQKVIKAEQDYFKKIVAEKVENGMFPTVAVYDTIEQRKAEYVKDQIKLANSMLQFAEDMGQKGFKKEAQSLASEAQEIIKEAGFLGNTWNRLKGQGNVYQTLMADFRNDVAVLSNLLSQYSQSPKAGFNQRNAFKTTLQSTRLKLSKKVKEVLSRGFLSQIANYSVEQLAIDFGNAVVPIWTAMSAAKDKDEFKQAVDQGIPVLSQISAEFAERVEQIDAQAEQGTPAAEEQQGQGQQTEMTPLQQLTTAINANNMEGISTALLNLDEGSKAQLAAALRRVQMTKQKAPPIAAKSRSTLKQAQVNWDNIANNINEMAPNLVAEFLQTQPQQAPAQQTAAPATMSAPEIAVAIESLLEGKPAGTGRGTKGGAIRYLRQRIKTIETTTNPTEQAPAEQAPPLQQGMGQTVAKSYFRLVK